MKRIRVAFVLLPVITLALAVGVPAASASLYTVPALGVPYGGAAGSLGPAGPCATVSPHSGQGATAGTNTQVCARGPG